MDFTVILLIFFLGKPYLQIEFVVTTLADTEDMNNFEEKTMND